MMGSDGCAATSVEQRGAAQSGHGPVGDDRIEGLAAELQERLFAAVREVAMVAGVSEMRAQRRRELGVVIDDQEGGRGRSHRLNVITNRALCLG